MTAPEQPTPEALKAAVDLLWPHWTAEAGSVVTPEEWAATDPRCLKLAARFDRFAAQRAAEAVATLRCAACDGHYPNQDCPHLRNARDMGERIPCVPALPATPPPGDAGERARIESLAREADNLAQQLVEGAKRDGVDTYTVTLLLHASGLIDRQAAALQSERTAADRALAERDAAETALRACAAEIDALTAAASQARRETLRAAELACGPETWAGFRIRALATPQESAS